MARRRYQKGSLWKDVDRWIARWREDVVLPNGEIRRKQREEILASLKECPTEKLARRKLDERLREINHLDYTPASTETFARFAERWMKTIMIHHKRSTIAGERGVIQKHLVPAFGEFALREIRTEMLQHWIAHLNVAPKTVRNRIAVLQMMWGTAKAWGYVQGNPFEGLRLPAVTEDGMYNFSLEETLAIIQKATGWKKLLLRVGAETGARPGEIAGLRCAGVHGRILEISQSIFRGEIQTPKSRAAVRRIAISSSLGVALAKHIAEMPPNPYGLVFVSGNGKPLNMDNFRHRVLNPILKELGIRGNTGKRIGLYAFRHMNATLMDSLGTPLKTRQSRHGHAQIETTLKHYTHAVDEQDMAVAEQIGVLLDARQEGEAVQ